MVRIKNLNLWMVPYEPIDSPLSAILLDKRKVSATTVVDEYGVKHPGFIAVNHLTEETHELVGKRYLMVMVGLDETLTAGELVTCTRDYNKDKAIESGRNFIHKVQKIDSEIQSFYVYLRESELFPVHTLILEYLNISLDSVRSPSIHLVEPPSPSTPPPSTPSSAPSSLPSST